MENKEDDFPVIKRILYSNVFFDGEYLSEDDIIEECQTTFAVSPNKTRT